MRKKDTWKTCTKMYHSRMHCRWNSCLQLVTWKAREGKRSKKMFLKQSHANFTFICEKKSSRKHKIRMLRLQGHFCKSPRGICCKHHHRLLESPLLQRPLQMSHDSQSCLPSLEPFYMPAHNFRVQSKMQYYSSGVLQCIIFPTNTKGSSFRVIIIQMQLW